MRALGFHHAAVQVRDVEAVARFYREVLGLPELKRHHLDDGTLRSVWLGVGGSEGFLAVERHLDGAHGGLGWSVVALRIEPTARGAVKAALAKQGVPIEKESVWTLYVRDPEGNQVALSHHPFEAAVTE